MRSIAFIFFLIFSLSLKSQVFWTENFGGGACSGGLSAIGFNSGNGAWAVTNTGANGGSANAWFVSAKERGMGAGVCGAGCGGTNDRTLHIGSTGLFLDLGASYNETGAANATDKRVESPFINCTGQSGITLAFTYMENGQGTLDNATLWYFDGTAWSQLIDIPKTLCCANAVCTGFNQGLWVNYSIALPASADNNPSVKIGFRWVNNGNGVGTDPSVAVDNITLSAPVPLPLELINFSHRTESGNVRLSWETASEKDFDHFEIEKSSDASGFITIGNISSNNNNKYNYYSFTDHNKQSGNMYYRLKVVDKNKSFSYSKILAAEAGVDDAHSSPVFYNPDNTTIEVRQTGGETFEVLYLYDIQGKLVMKVDPIKDDPQAQKYLVEKCVPGLYFCILEGTSDRKVHKIFIGR